MARYGMLIDTRRCVGCFACRVACQMKNTLAPKEGFIHFEHLESGTFPNVDAEVVPMQCMHCKDAPCQHVCPTGATYTNDDGVVLVDAEKCIGCKYCMVACPYGVRMVEEETGVVEKCRFCWSDELGGPNSPSCVGTCIADARIFGDLDDPDSDVAKAIAELDAQPIAGDLTDVKIFYVR